MTSKFLEHVTSTAFHLTLSHVQLRALYYFHFHSFPFMGLQGVGHLSTWQVLVRKGLLIWRTFTLKEAHEHHFVNMTQEKLDAQGTPGNFELTKEGKAFCEFLDQVGMFEQFKELEAVA